MENKQFCKIVEDLLPNYIEEMTSKETNKLIEEHLKKCQVCKNKLNNMKSDIIVDKIDDREIEYLKKIKRKNLLKILIVTLTFCVILSLVLWFNFNYRIRKDDNGIYKIERASINYRNISNNNILILKGKQESENGIDGTIYIKWYAIIENKTKKCIDIIEELDNYKEEIAEEQYKELEKNWNELTNPRIKENKIYTNNDAYNGKTKEELIELFKSFYNVIEIDEL